MAKIRVAPDTQFEIEYGTMIKPRSMYDPDPGYVEYMHTGLNYHWINGRPVTEEEFNDALHRWRELVGKVEQPS